MNGSEQQTVWCALLCACGAGSISRRQFVIGADVFAWQSRGLALSRREIVVRQPQQSQSVYRSIDFLIERKILALQGGTPGKNGRNYYGVLELNTDVYAWKRADGKPIFRKGSEELSSLQRRVREGGTVPALTIPAPKARQDVPEGRASADDEEADDVEDVAEPARETRLPDFIDVWTAKPGVVP